MSLTEEERVRPSLEMDLRKEVRLNGVSVSCRGKKKKKLLKAGTQTSPFKNGLCKSVQFRATKLTPVPAFCHVQQYPVNEKPVEKAVHWPVSASVSGP